jgi:VCBS repeat protein
VKNIRQIIPRFYTRGDASVAVEAWPQRASGGVEPMGYRFPRTTFLFLTWALVSASVASAQPLSFARDEVASVARGIVTGDFDRNGWPDVAQANAGANSVSVLLNHNGTLSRAADIAVGAGPFDLTAGDFSRDGILDLTVANADANSISTGDGTGAFASPGSFVGYATQPQGIAAADFNHDGHMDVAAVYDSTGGLAILYGTGDARIFEPAAHAVAGPQKLARQERQGRLHHCVRRSESAAAARRLYLHGHRVRRSRRLGDRFDGLDDYADEGNRPVRRRCIRIRRRVDVCIRHDGGRGSARVQSEPQRREDHRSATDAAGNRRRFRSTWKSVPAAACQAGGGKTMDGEA